MISITQIRLFLQQNPEKFFDVTADSIIKAAHAMADDEGLLVNVQVEGLFSPTEAQRLLELASKDPLYIRLGAEASKRPTAAELVAKLHQILPLKPLSGTVTLREIISDLDGSEFQQFKDTLIDLFMRFGLLDEAYQRAVSHLMK